MRRIGSIALALVVLFGLLGFVGVPLLLRHVVVGRVAKLLERRVDFSEASFNPYTLRLTIEKLHVGERSAASPFVDIGRLSVRASWASLFRLAPVIKTFAIDRPSIRIVRTAPDRFNFSDLIEKFSTPQPKPRAKPQRFAVSNIQIAHGVVQFDDKVLGQSHVAKQIALGIPFIANLPADVNIFVQPLLDMVVDGSHFRVTGKAKPFASPPESVIDVKFHRLDLTQYLAYAPKELLIRPRQGELSCALEVHFINAPQHPLVRLSGAIAIDQLDLRDVANAPVLQLQHAVTTINDLQPLDRIIRLDRVFVGGLTAYVVLKRNGTNLTPIATNQGPKTPPGPATAQAPAGAPPLNDLTVNSFELTDSKVNLTDNRGVTPATAALEAIHIGLKNVQSNGQTPASYDISANLSGGGSIAISGSLDLAGSQATSDVTLGQLELPALQGFAPTLVAARLAAGKLNAHAHVQTAFAPGHFNVHAEPATISLDEVEFNAPEGGEKPLGWKRLNADIGQVDLQGRRAVVNEVRADALHVFTRRGRDGALSLAALIRPPTSSETAGAQNKSTAGANQKAAEPPASKAPAPWQYRLSSVVAENLTAGIEDDSADQPLELTIAPIALHAKDISSDMAKPILFDLTATVNHKGSLRVAGTAAPSPLQAKLQIETRDLDLSSVDRFISDRVKAKIAGAALTMKGALDVAKLDQGMHVNYRGDAALGDVRMLDRLTSDEFLQWKTLAARGIRFGLRDGPPRIEASMISLENFYGRIILKNDGRLNLADVLGAPRSAPASLTRTESTTPQPPNPPPQARPTAAKPLPANIRIGHIAMKGGRLNYTDNFIQPNYSADVTAIAGEVGTLSTAASAPADVNLHGRINRSAPVEITGSINPLAAHAFVDLTTKAKAVDLPGVTPYSTKYTGYPITKGRLSADVHYLLKDEALTAQNHLLIEQLTFGDRVPNPTATNLPIRLAVALLKDNRGNINLNLPISGSLSDPQFSIGSLLAHALVNLITKAATSPFSVIAASFGSKENLDRIEFAPGMATLTSDSQSRLDTIARALRDRPGLQLDISGRVDPKVDGEGLREAKLSELIREQKLKDTGQTESTESGEHVEIKPDEYDTYLKQAYKAAAFPKPKNIIGLNKSLTPDEMKKLLLTHIKVNDADFKQLADARANAVRQYLSGKTDPARIFVVAPTLNADGIRDNSKTTRVDLSLK